MAFLSQKVLETMGFKYLGREVQISDKCSIYNADQISIGDFSRVDDFCVLSGKITIGRNVHIAVFCHLGGGEKGITMEDFSGTAYGTYIFTQSDDYRGTSLTNPTVPDRYKNEIKLPVLIKKHVIIGTSCVVFPGVTLEEGCSVGAMSLVTKNTEAWKVYVGVPAKAVSDRKRDMLELEKSYLQECP